MHPQLAPPARRAAGSPVCEPPSTIHFNSVATSAALCHLSSASLARHFVTAWPRAGGAMGWRAATGGGSELMMAEITLAWLSPSNALRPVTAS